MSWKMNLDELLEGTAGRLVSKGPTEFTGISTDGRADNEGKIFFPLKGEKFDAHDFVGQAAEHKARVFVVNKPVAQLKFGVPTADLTIIQTDDTLAALQ